MAASESQGSGKTVQHVWDLSKGTESAFRGDGMDDEARGCVAGAAPELPTSGGAGRRARRRTPKRRSPLMPWPAPAASSGVLSGLFRARCVECRQRNLAKRESPCQGSLRCAWMVPGSTPPQEWVRERLVPQANWARGRPLPRRHSGASSRISGGLVSMSALRCSSHGRACPPPRLFFLSDSTKGCISSSIQQRQRFSEG